MEYQNKFNMTKEQNIFVAKRNIVDYIWKSAKLEGINVTFPEIQKIYDGGNVAKLRIDEIITINNLKHAWQFILNTLELPLDFKYLCSINAVVGSNLIAFAGNLRSGEVKIGGTDWKPTLPNTEEYKNNMQEMDKIQNVIERSISKMCYIMRSQLFWDGNKRTAMLFANHDMITNGAGIITIPVDIRDLFGRELIKYYETGEMKDLKTFIYEHCIDGIDFVKKEER